MAIVRSVLVWSLCFGLFAAGCQKKPPVESDPNACPSGCASGEVCKLGKCFPAQCETERCGALEVCVNGACASSACVGVACPGDQLCADGNCYPRKCGADFCKSSEVCRDSQCVDARCVGVQCGADEICASGRCYSPSCGGQACAAGAVCEAGSCVELACAGIVCPQGLKCVAGVCSSVCPPGQEWSGGECVTKQGAPTPQSIRSVPATVSIPKGTALQLKAEEVWTDGSVTDITSTATWVQGSCFFVQPGGMVTATGDWGCQEAIHIQQDGLDGIALVTVGDAIVIGLQVVDPTVQGTTFNWRVDESHHLLAKYVWSDLTTSNVNASGLIWSTSDSSVIALNPDPSDLNARYGHGLRLGTAGISVTLDGRTAAATVNVNGYPPLAVSHVAPTVGYPGGIISVYGSGFDPNPSGNVVQIGAQQASAAAVGPGQMLVKLPAQAGFGALTISTDGGSVTAAEPVVVGLPDASYLSPPSPSTDQFGYPMGQVLVDGYLLGENGNQSYYQPEKGRWASPVTLTFDLHNAQQPVGHVAVRAVDAPNGGSVGFVTFLVPTAIHVSVADDLAAFDGGSPAYTSYFVTENPPTYGRMRALIVPTPGAAGRFVQVTIDPSTTQLTISDEILFTPD